MLDKKLSEIFDSITNQWDRNTIQISIKETLLTKRKRVSDEEAYFNSLCENIAYLAESSHPIKKVLESCFQKNMLWDTTNAESFIMDSQNILREEMPTLSSIYKKKLRKNSLSESVSEAEFSYAYSKLRNDIEIDFLFAFLHTNNRSFMTPFLNSEPTQFFTTVDRLSDFYTNLLLQNIGLTVPDKKEASKQITAAQEAATREVATREAAAAIQEAATREVATREAAAAIQEAATREVATREAAAAIQEAAAREAAAAIQAIATRQEVRTRREVKTQETKKKGLFARLFGK